MDHAINVLHAHGIETKVIGEIPHALLNWTASGNPYHTWVPIIPTRRWLRNFLNY